MVTVAATTVDARPTLHVEVQLKSLAEGFGRTDLVCEEVENWLVSQFIGLQVNQVLQVDQSALSYRNVIESIKVVEFTGVEAESSYYRLSDVQLDVQAYELRDHYEKEETGGSGKDLIPAEVIPLPSKSLDGFWEVLSFDTATPTELLRYLTRMMALLRTYELSLKVFNWNRLLLLHGPPGTGKTTLCLALAQKLTIRLGRYFTQGKLVRINSHSALSKYFSESGKLVAKLFEDIQAMAKDNKTLICVFIDEVESLTGS